MSEPERPEGQAERAIHAHDDALLDDLSGRVSALVRHLLPGNVTFVFVLAIEREHYVHTCVGTDMTPKGAVFVLEHATGDLKAMNQ